MMWIFIALLAGAFLPVEAAVNATLRGPLGHPVWAALASFTVGTLSLGIYALAARLPIPKVEWAGLAAWQWSGGVIGALFVSLAIVLTPKLGTATTFSLVICGQLLTSLLLDHMGWFGLTQHSMNAPRIVGALLLFAGVWLIQNF